MTSTVPLVRSQPELEALFARFRGAPLLAVDTEAASFHRFTDRVYLLQVSSRDETAVVDPLAVESLAPLAEALADPEVEIVFHDADYDLRLLDREYGYRATRIFDTRIAAQLLNEPGVGLAALLEKYLGVRLDKRFQRADWSARPLSPEMLEYAASDTRHLPRLRDILKQQLEARGRLSWAEEEFALLDGIRWAPPDGEPAYLRLKGAKALKGRELAILRELHEWREGVAQRADRATFRILNNEPMLLMARQPPADLAALKAIPGIGGEQAERRGREILAAVKRGQEVPDRDLPRIERPPRRPARPGARGTAGAAQGRPQPARHAARPGPRSPVSQRHPRGHRQGEPDESERHWRPCRSSGAGSWTRSERSFWRRYGSPWGGRTVAGQT